MAEVEIGFVSGLKAQDSVTENLLASLYNIQTPIRGIIEWDTLGIGMSNCRVSRCRCSWEPTKEPIDVDQ